MADIEVVETSRTQRFVTFHVAFLLWTVISALAGLAVLCVFRPPQEWTNVTAIVQTLKDLAFMLTGGWLALLRQDPHRDPPAGSKS